MHPVAYGVSHEAPGMNRASKGMKHDFCHRSMTHAARSMSPEARDVNHKAQVMNHAPQGMKHKLCTLRHTS